MLRIVQGVPGSGKSYYAVNYIYKYFCVDDDIYNVLISKDVLLITNIEDLSLSHLDLDASLKKYGGVEKFFTVDNFENIKKNYKGRHIVLIIDECQKYFPTFFKNKDVFFFFQYHRHLGIDVILLTQSITTICKELVVLAETVITAVPRSTQVFSSFRYHENVYTNGRLIKIRTFVIKKSNKVFRLYSSFKADEVTKPKSVLKTYVIVTLLLFLFSFVGIYYFFHSGFFSGSSIQKRNKDNLTSKNKGKVNNIKSNKPDFPKKKPLNTPVPAPDFSSSSRYVKPTFYIFRGNINDKYLFSLIGSKKVLTISKYDYKLHKCFLSSNSMFISCYYPLFDTVQSNLIVSLYPDDVQLKKEKQ